MRGSRLAKRFRYALDRKAVVEPEYYLGEGLESFHSQSDLVEITFKESYEAAVGAVGADYGIRQRMRLLSWAGQQAMKADPTAAFVELGTGRGFSMLFLLNYLRRLDLHPKVYLFDTFHPDLSVAAKRQGARSAGRQFYADSLDAVTERFRGFASCQIVPGLLPKTLDLVDLPHVGFAHIDLNDGTAEIQSITALWPKLADGALLILDDFANRGRQPQRDLVLRQFQEWDIPVLSTPQGQGLAIKR